MEAYRRNARRASPAAAPSNIVTPLENLSASLATDELVVSYGQFEDGLWAFLLDHGGLVANQVNLGTGPDGDELAVVLDPENIPFGLFKTVAS